MKRWILTLWWRVLVWADPRWILRPDCPMWFVDDQLRRRGLDPDEVAAHGAALAEELFGKKGTPS